MPNGDVHNKATLILGAVTIPAAFLVSDVYTAAWYAAGVGLGIVTSPDLDQSESHAVTPQEMVGNYFGEYPEYIWRFIWYPYGLLIGHRSWVSHFPIVGTLVRVAYLYGWYWLMCWILRIEPIFFAPPTPLIVGLCAADTLHFVLDQLPFFREKKKRTRNS